MLELCESRFCRTADLSPDAKPKSSMVSTYRALATPATIKRYRVEYTVVEEMNGKSEEKVKHKIKRHHKHLVDNDIKVIEVPKKHKRSVI